MTKNKTSFKKGFDSKRYVPINQGLVAFHQELSSLLRDQSLDAVSFLVNTMNNEAASLKLRVVAAHTILDRGLGKAVDRTVIATIDAGTAQADPSKLTDEQLLQLVNSSVNNNIIDADFIEVP